MIENEYYEKEIERLLWKNFGGGDERLRRSLVQLVREASDSQGPDGERLVRELLDRYTYLSNDEYDDAINSIAEYISTEFEIKSTLLCASTADHEKDSAQRVLYDVVTALGFWGISKIKSVNRYDSAHRHAADTTDLILLDEFVGTGRSMKGRINTLHRNFRSKNLPIPKIHIIIVVGMDFGMRRIAHMVSTLYPCISLSPGLRGFLDGARLKDAYSVMDAIEGMLAAEYEGKALPKYGDGGCEALYARKSGNCPNSVFPIFWWPVSTNGIWRQPAFPRVF